jgi:hypothetical protein
MNDLEHQNVVRRVNNQAEIDRVNRMIDAMEKDQEPIYWVILIIALAVLAGFLIDANADDKDVRYSTVYSWRSL